MGSPVAGSQSRAVLSAEAVKSRRPSGLNRADSTLASCLIGLPMGLQVPASHNRALLSQEAVTTRWLSGLNSAHLTTFSCFIGSPMALPVVAFHSRADLSSEAVTTRWPSELNAQNARSLHASWARKWLGRQRHPIAARSYLQRRSPRVCHRD